MGKGRKALVIDWAVVDKYLRSMCDGTEIAAHLGISADTLYRACKREKKMLFQIYAMGKYAATRQLIREQQINRAIGYRRLESKPFNTAEGVIFKDVIVYYEPSDNMLKWTGKQYLNQKEHHDVLQEIPDFVVVGDTDDEVDDEEDEDDLDEDDDEEEEDDE